MTPGEFNHRVERVLQRPLLKHTAPNGRVNFRVYTERNSLTQVLDLVEELDAPVVADSLLDRHYQADTFDVVVTYVLSVSEGMQLVAREALEVAATQPNGLDILSGNEELPASLDQQTDWDSVEDDYLPGMLGGFILARVNTTSLTQTLGALPALTPAGQVLASLLTDYVADQGWGPDDAFMSDQIDLAIEVLGERTRTAMALEPLKITAVRPRAGADRGR